MRIRRSSRIIFNTLLAALLSGTPLYSQINSMSAYRDSLSKNTETRKTHQKWWSLGMASGGLLTLLSHNLANNAYAQYEETTSSNEAEKFWEIMEQRDLSTAILGSATLAIFAPVLLQQSAVRRNTADMDRIPLQYQVHIKDTSTQTARSFQLVEDGVVILYHQSYEKSTATHKGSGHHLLLSKVDWQGSQMWSKEIAVEGAVSTRGLSLSSSRQGLYILGIYQPIENADKGGTFLIKTTVTGDVVWMQKYTLMEGVLFSSNPENEGFIMVTNIGQPGTSVQYKVSSFDSRGNLKGSQPIASEHYISLQRILNTEDGWVLGGLCRQEGQIQSDIYIHKIDRSAKTQWSKTMSPKESSEFFNSMTLSMDNEIIVWATSVGEGGVEGFTITHLGTDGQQVAAYSNNNTKPGVGGIHEMCSRGGDLLLLGKNEKGMSLMQLDEDREIIARDDYLIEGESASLGLQEMSDGSLLFLNHHIGDHTSPSSVSIFRTFILDN